MTMAYARQYCSDRYFNDHLIPEDRYSERPGRNGYIELYLDRVIEAEAGLYKVVSRNRHGEEETEGKIIVAPAPGTYLP